MYGSLGLTVMPIMQAAPGILANSRKGYWRIAGSPILQAALSTAKLEKRSFQYFCSYYQICQSVNCGTSVHQTVRTVV